MRKELLNSFEKMRDSLLTSISDFFKKTGVKTINLTENPDYIILNECVITQIYKKLFLKNNELYIEYEYGEDFEPFEYHTTEEPLSYFSANEIYEILTRIKG